MTENRIARASVLIDADAASVWDALVRPELVRQYMFGTTVHSTFTEGSPIRWRGEWQGTTYEDHGVIQRVEPGRRLEYSHFSPRSGLPDVPENHHHVTLELREQEGRTLVALTQDRNESEQVRQHSEQNWRAMLEGLKRVVEQGRSAGATA